MNEWLNGRLHAARESAPPPGHRIRARRAGGSLDCPADDQHAAVKQHRPGQSDGAGDGHRGGGRHAHELKNP